MKSKAIANLPTISQIKASLPKSVKATGVTEDDWLVIQKKRGITPQEEIRKAIEDSIIKGDGSNNSGFLVTRYEILENSKYELTERKINENLSMFGFEKGGRPPVGQPSIVGEKGAELFVPDQAGTLVPNDKLGMGKQVTVNFNINTVDARGFNELLVNSRGVIVNLINSAMNEKGKMAVV